MIRHPSSNTKNRFRRGNTFLVVTITIAAAALLAGYVGYRKGIFTTFLTGQQGSSISNLANSLTQDPTSIPFYDLTIDYLQSRDYTSSLGQLQKVSETGSYTSYTTNYNSDGLKVNGLLTIPKGTDPQKKYPAIVFVHGYIPPTLYKTTSNYAAYVDYFARNGFVVFKIDLRGHDKSEGEASGAYYSGDYIVDTLNAYSALQNADFVDKQGVGLWGHSMAGNVVMRSVVAKKDIPAVVVWAGAGYTYEDLGSYGVNDNSYRPPETNTNRQKRREELRKQYGEFDPNSSFWRKIVSTNYLGNVASTAIQIHHAVDDTVVGVEYSRNLMQILDTTNISHELYEYPTGGHNITGASFNSAMQRSVEFFKNNL